MCKDRGYNAMFFIQQCGNDIIQMLYANKKSFCSCRHRILKIQWLLWVPWLYKIAYESLSNSIDPHNIKNDYIKSYENIQKAVEEDPYTDNEIAKMFFELHSVAVDEYLDSINKVPEESMEMFINRLAGTMKTLFLDSLISMKQLIVFYKDDFLCEKCMTHAKITCPFGYGACTECNNLGCLSMRVNNLFDINSYAKNKISKLAEILKDNKVNPKDYLMVFIIDKPIQLYKPEKFTEALDVAKSKFKDVQILAGNVSIKNTFKDLAKHYQILISPEGQG